jgi:cell division protein FtsW
MLVIVCALVGIGVVAVYSASAMISEATYGGTGRFLTTHLVAIALGVGVGMGMLCLPYATIRRMAPWVFVAGLVLVALVDLWGQEAGGARRWFRVGRLSLQPSALIQLGLVLYLADFLARRSAEIHDFRRGVLPALIATGVAAGLVVIQPDLGTTVAIGAVALLLLVIAKARWPHVAGVAAVAGVAVAVLLATAGYRRRRLLSFLDPWEDPLGAGYQIIQSYLAFANGGLVGEGIGGSLQKLFFLPNAHTDFIFAIIGEELGLVGTSAVIGLFALWIGCGCRIAVAAGDLFSKYLVLGLVGMVGFEVMVNMAVVTGLLPTKGLPLPFISYGGSSMVINLAACGLILRASRHSERLTVPTSL